MTTEDLRGPRWKGKFCKEGVKKKRNNLSSVDDEANDHTEPTEEKFELHGSRIVHVGWLSAQLARGCIRCQAQLHITDITNENRVGLACVWTIVCVG